MKNIKLGTVVRIKEETIRKDADRKVKISKNSLGIICHIHDKEKGIVLVELLDKTICEFPVFSFAFNELEILDYIENS